MTKRLKCVKTSLIMAVLLFSIFAVFAPSSSAKLLTVSPLITITHDKADNIIPRSGTLEINLSVSLVLSGIGSTYVETRSLLASSPISITLEVEEQYDWIDASISNSNAEIKISETGKAWEASRVTLTVTEKAPAFTLGKVKIIAKSQKLSGILFEIESVTATADVPFEVGYWPVVNFELPEGNFKEIGPLDTADFPIEINNLANGMTDVRIEVLDGPEGDWVVSLPSSVKLSDFLTEERKKSTIHLTIKPPFGFGFHNDRASFKIKFTPQYFGANVGRPELMGQPEIIQFNVQSIGMSPGAGFELPMIITVLVVLFIGVYFYKRKKK